MAKDDAGNEIEQVVDNNVVVDKKEEDVEVKEEVKDEDLNDDQKEAKSKKGIFEKITNIIKGKKDDDSDNDVVGNDIPSEFVTAALEAGYTQEQIEDFAVDYTDTELLNQIPYLKQSSVDSDKSDKTTKKDEVTQDKEPEKKEADKKSAEDENADLKEVVRKLQEKVDKLEESDKKNIDKESQEVMVQQATKATKAMDDLSKEYEVFGTYEKLPRFPDGKIIPNSPANIARNEVWSLTVALANSGTDFDSALQTAIHAYKGQHLEKVAERNVIKSLKRNEKKLTPKHTSHEPAAKAMSGPELIRATGKKLGVDIR